MQSLTSLTSNRRRFMRLAGTGATALLARDRGGHGGRSGHHAGRRTHRRLGQCGFPQRIEHGGPEPSSGQSTVNWSTTTTFSKTVTQAVSTLAAGDCVTVNGTPSEVQDDDAARTITVSPADSSGSCTVGGRTGSQPRAPAVDFPAAGAFERRYGRYRCRER